MIRVTVELLPFGSEVEKKLLDLIHIANDGTGTSEIGNYKAKVTREDGQSSMLKIENFNRKIPIDGELRLLREVLDAYLR